MPVMANWQGIDVKEDDLYLKQRSLLGTSNMC